MGRTPDTKCRQLLQAIALSSLVLHYLLLTHSKLGHISITTVVMFSMLVSSLYVRCTVDIVQTASMAFFSPISNKLYMLSSVDRTVTANWSFIEYYCFLMTGRTRKTVLLTKKNAPPFQQKRNIGYFFKVASCFAVDWVLALFLFAYNRKYRPFQQEDSPRYILNFLDPWAIADVVCVVATLCVTMDFNYHLSCHFMEQFFDVDIPPTMNSPILSTSLRDFWDDRWNLTVKESLQFGVFRPVLSALERIRPSAPPSAPTSQPPDAKAPHLPPPQAALRANRTLRLTYISLSVLATFFASGLHHEWVFALTAAGWRSDVRGVSVLFFCLQGAMCVMQDAAQRATGFGKTWGRRENVGWLVLGWVATFAALGVFAPMGARPFAVCGILDMLEVFMPIPRHLIEKVMTWI
ncbi:hypothetical protein DFJ73DRAFT_827492 [Zopfochytrium polystomum]|nr:hypothetical protein DFJ73DRAFT_827492 [Zopfochytrium polystomum]